MLDNSQIKGFNTLVCFVLLTCNLMRIFFWFGKRFSLVLVWQGIVMMIAQLFLLELCVRVKRMRERRSIRLKFTVTDLTKNFWEWGRIEDYLLFMGTIALVLTVLNICFIYFPVYVEILGEKRRRLFAMCDFDFLNLVIFGKKVLLQL